MINKNEFIAMVRHISWCSYQIGCGQEYNEEINGGQLESLLNGVEFMLDNPDISPEENHNNWMNSKYNQGWKYGVIKDFELKTHPDLVPFEKLPLIEQNKDVLSNVSHRMALNLYNKIMDD